MRSSARARRHDCDDPRSDRFRNHPPQRPSEIGPFGAWRFVLVARAGSYSGTPTASADTHRYRASRHDPATALLAKKKNRPSGDNPGNLSYSSVFTFPFSGGIDGLGPAPARAHLVWGKLVTAQSGAAACWATGFYSYHL